MTVVSEQSAGYSTWTSQPWPPRGVIHRLLYGHGWWALVDRGVPTLSTWERDVSVRFPDGANPYHACVMAPRSRRKDADTWCEEFIKDLMQREAQLEILSDASRPPLREVSGAPREVWEMGQLLRESGRLHMGRYALPFINEKAELVWVALTYGAAYRTRVLECALHTPALSFCPLDVSLHVSKASARAYQEAELQKKDMVREVAQLAELQNVAPSGDWPKKAYE